MILFYAINIYSSDVFPGQFPAAWTGLTHWALHNQGRGLFDTRSVKKGYTVTWYEGTSPFMILPARRRRDTAYSDHVTTFLCETFPPFDNNCSSLWIVQSVVIPRYYSKELQTTQHVSGSEI